ncbi:MAG: hypothetical protein ACRDJM_00230, partial [Actinomycetota bacterium]
TYTTTAADQYGNPLGNVTPTTTFSIGPDGSCAGATCTATVAGAHTVTGINGAASATASLSVIAGPLHHIAILPAEASIAIGSSQTYQSQGRDIFDNSTGDLTPTTTFSIAPTGSCSGNTCTPAVVAEHSVTGTRAGMTATAVLHVISDQIARIEISPSSASIVAGASQAYTAEAFDAGDVSLGDVTGSTVFTIGPNGQCSGNVCSAQLAGPHTVTGTAGGVSDIASLTVTPGPATRLNVQPAFATIVAGGSRMYTAQARDQYGNVVGDVTAATTFTIAPDGSCTLNSCTASVPGIHTVTGLYGTATGTAQLTVTPAAPVIVLPPQGSVQPAQVAISGTAPLGTTVSVYDNGTQIATGVPVGSGGDWSVTRTLANGNHAMTAYATTGTVTSPASAVRSFRVDAFAPTVMIRKQLGYVLFATYLPFETVAVAGTASDDAAGIAAVEVTYVDFFSGEEVAQNLVPCSGPCMTTAWEDQPSLAPGMYDVTAVAIDRAGNRSAPATITILTTSLVSEAQAPRHGGRIVE